MADYTYNAAADNSLEADLYSAGQMDADIENIAGSGNINAGLVIDYDAKTERRLSGTTAHGDDSINHASQQYVEAPAIASENGEKSAYAASQAPTALYGDLGNGGNNHAFPEHSADSSALLQSDKSESSSGSNAAPAVQQQQFSSNSAAGDPASTGSQTTINNTTNNNTTEVYNP